MSTDEDLNEPEVLHDEIVHWQPDHRPPATVGMTAATGGVASLGAASLLAAVGALAVGALAIGALSIGALAIGRIAIGRARFRDVVIDRLVVRKLKVLER